MAGSKCPKVENSGIKAIKAIKAIKKQRGDPRCSIHLLLSSFHFTGFQAGSTNMHCLCTTGSLNTYVLDVGLPNLV